MMPMAVRSPFACCGTAIAYHQRSHALVVDQNSPFMAQSTPRGGTYKECAINHELGLPFPLNKQRRVRWPDVKLLLTLGRRIETRLRVDFESRTSRG
jgi:hypothetical protein